MPFAEMATDLLRWWQAFFHRFLLGVVCIGRGLRSSVECPSPALTLRLAGWFLAGSAAFALTAATLVYCLLFLPLRLLVLVLPAAWFALDLSFFDIFAEVFFYLPWLYLTALRWCFWTSADREFFRALELRAPDDLGKSMAAMPLQSLWSAAYRSLGRWSKLVLVGVALKFLSLTPVLGAYVLAAAHFYWTSRVLGYPNALGIGLVSWWWPHTQVWTGALVNICFAGWGIAQELLASYYLRLPRAVVAHSRQKNRALLLGLGIPAVLLLAVPVVGPLCWLPLVRSAAFVSIMLESEDRNLALI